MIVVRHGSALEVITQNDHARLAGQILELIPRLAAHPHRAALILAGHRHDVGWQEVDSAPEIDARGEPYDFLTQPTATRLEIWQRSVDRVLDKDRFAGLLVILHASRLYTESLERSHDSPEPDSPSRRRSDVAVLDELERLQALHETLLDELGVHRSEAQAAYGWLDLADLLSLVACNRWQRPLHRTLPDGTELRILWDGDALRLDPLLLAGNTTLDVPTRPLERRTFGRSIDYAMALARAPWQTRAVPIKSLPTDIL